VLDCHLNIVKATHFDALTSPFLPAREGCCEGLELALAELDLEVEECGDEVVHEDLIRVIGVSLCLQHSEEVAPFVFHPSFNVLHQDESLLLHHFHVNFAIDGKVLSSVPAVVALATLDAGLPRHILSPVLTLVWLHLLTYGLLEVLIRDLAVLVLVEIVEKLRELVLGGNDTPMREVELEIVWLDSPLFANVHLHESLAHGLPLLVDFHHHLVDQVLIVSLFALVKVFLGVLHVEALRVQVEWRIDCL